MCLPGNSGLSSTKEDHQNKLLVTCYLLLLGNIHDAGTSETDNSSTGEFIAVNVIDDAASYK